MTIEMARRASIEFVCIFGHDGHEDYGELALDAKVEMIRSLVPLGLMHVHELPRLHQIGERAADRAMRAAEKRPPERPRIEAGATVA